MPLNLCQNCTFMKKVQFFLSKRNVTAIFHDPVKRIYMQLGNRQSMVSLSSISFNTFGSLGSHFVFPAVLSAPQVVGKMLSVNPNKVDKWKK